jgi:hypothetical protein
MNRRLVTSVSGASCILFMMPGDFGESIGGSAFSFIYCKDLFRWLQSKAFFDGTIQPEIYFLFAHELRCRDAPCPSTDP